MSQTYANHAPARHKRETHAVLEREGEKKRKKRKKEKKREEKKALLLSMRKEATVEISRKTSTDSACEKTDSKMRHYTTSREQSVKCSL